MIQGPGSIRRRRAGLAMGLTLLLGVVFLGAEEPSKPRDIGLTEKVQVRLVTMDIVVLDGKDRAVPGLKPEDFELRVDDDAVPVDTLDEACVGGGLDEPEAVRLAENRPPLAPGETPRRIAWVLDYQHLDFGARDRTFTNLRALARGRALEGTEVLVAALTGGLRVEQTFTGDVNRLLQTLDRMERDVTLWNGNFRHTTEEGLFAAMDALCDILAVVPGSKAAVVFSGWQAPRRPLTLEMYEPQFLRLSALASDARVTFYPVEVEGLSAEPGSFG